MKRLIRKASNYDSMVNSYLGKYTYDNPDDVTETLLDQDVNYHTIDDNALVKDLANECAEDIIKQNNLDDSELNNIIKAVESEMRARIYTHTKLFPEAIENEPDYDSAGDENDCANYDELVNQFARG